jgi:lysozyme family protein
MSRRPAVREARRFDRALAFVFAREGGFSDHPEDPGGATRFGITRATLERERGRPVTAAEVAALSREEAARIYRRAYWDAVRAGDLPDGLDLAVFDCAVNSGPGTAVRLLQRVLAVPADGVVGPVTLAAARRAGPAAALRHFTRARLAYLAGLPTWRVFGRGWRRRVLAAEQAGLAAARIRSPADHSPTDHSTRKDHPMFDTKSILASRTVWTNLIGLAAVCFGAAGFDTSSLDAQAFADAAIRIVAAGSFIASTVFRIVATRRLLS